MRIISGKYKGRKINPPGNLPVRPTTDMSKEALFNILNNYFHFEDLKVLDLFAGTGNISYEFASRGCKNITVVDIDFGCVKFMKEVVSKLDFNISIVKADVFKFIASHKAKYDVVFADPPYNLEQKDFEKLVNLIFENDLVSEKGMLIIEHSKHTTLDYTENFSFKKNYGGSVFSFFELPEEEHKNKTSL